MLSVRRSFAELFALCGLAITQPVLDVFGDAPDLFLHRGAGRFDIVLFALVVAVVPAALLLEVELLVGLKGPEARRRAHLGLVGLLLVLLAAVALKQAEVASGLAMVALALALAGAGSLAYRRWSGIRQWVAYLAAAPVLFVGLFLVASPTADLLADQDVAAADIGPLAHPRPVVLLQFDEWPLETILDGDGEIDAELYPNLAELAGDGVWYRNATTAATFTTYAIPAVLTGREPDGDRSPVASEYPENLFTLLAGELDLDVLETVTRLCPTNLCDGDLVDEASSPGGAGEADDGGGPAQALRHLLTDARQAWQAMVSPDPDAASAAETLEDDVSSTPAGPDPAAAVDDARSSSATLEGAPPPVVSLESVDALVGSIEEGEAPTVHFLHVLLPHTPYKFLPDGRRYSTDSGGLSVPLSPIVTGRSEEPAAAAFDEQRLLLQAAYTDTVIGRVTDRLREAGLYDDAIVVVAADHGIGLTPGGAVRAPVGDELPRENYPDLFYVPLVVKAPGLGPAGTVSDANVSTIDIVPTIAGSLGVHLPWSVDGIDLAREERATAEKATYVVTFGERAGSGLRLGDRIRYDGEEVQAAVLARNVDTLLLADNPDYRLYDIDPAGELVGEEADSLPGAPVSGVTAVLADPGAFRGLDLSSGLVPAHLVADLHVPASGPLTVAVVVNGTVAAVSPTWRAGEEAHHLEAMLLPDTFVDGDNTVELYVVGGPEDGRTLSEIPLGV